ncbi:hypothetical protein FVEG_17465 [Fusarium verticillioides 7600]|uniref:Uncharacterized protein n=1 Tax=Gibberella moniliformis (strain M3125 / FGSC 7600) TaxID=334819 RepID=W7MUH5_GIBM7|nr:hypothetical protein FVEG_17465 [Fusarium verticillioides 7600]XP_018761355.1 hypothetical protein FVEG_17465 [Fusarium verticillioides 7600]EWG55163.1 hypothetical protein FVEG_17465 [Fusarium verticillioides 7600]EWG55164.1 hypothetical protein FVEG_17465 [Fusarium verticillioides 7600]
MLLYSIIVTLTIFSLAAMALLTARDAIHADDLERYDEVMKTVAGNQILNFYLKNQVVKLDIHEYPTEQIVESEVFKPSLDADAYFKQEAELAKKFLQQHSGGGDNVN